MLSVTPERTPLQRDIALVEANRVRYARADMKRDMKAGLITIEEILLNPPEYINTMKLIDLLVAIPRWGQIRATKALSYCRISPTKTVGGLTERQRRELLYRLITNSSRSS